MAKTHILTGNIFTTTCQTIVNTVNCVGVMGAGIALECRLRYPGMYSEYLKLCDAGQIAIGNLWLYKAADRWILNFPTKTHWRYPSKEQYLHAGLKHFMDTYVAVEIKSIAFPLLGAAHGGLDPDRALELMESYLSNCSIPVEIYRYDLSAPDDLYEAFRERILAMTTVDLKSSTGLGTNAIERIREALRDPSLRQLNQLAGVDGIGAKTLEKVFAFAREPILADHAVHPIQQRMEF